MANGDEAEEAGEVEESIDGITLSDPLSNPPGPQGVASLDNLVDQFRRNPSGENAQKILRLLGLQTVEPRRAGISEAILQQRRLAAGSPREIVNQLSSEITQIQRNLQATSQALGRRGGPRAGGQPQRLRAAALDQAATQLQQLTTQAILGGRAGLLNIATGVRPLTALQIPAPRESIESGGLPFGQIGQLTASLGQQLNRLFQTPGAPPAFAPVGVTGAGQFSAPRGSALPGFSQPAPLLAPTPATVQPVTTTGTGQFF